MIIISKIDNSLSIYKNNNVVIYGKGEKTYHIVTLLQRHNIHICAICDSSLGEFGEFMGVNLISFDSFQKLDFVNTIVQLSTSHLTLLQSKLPYDKIITFDEAFQVLNFLDKLKLTKKFPQVLTKLQKQTANLKHYTAQKVNDSIINSASSSEQLVMLCLPPKTGDHSLMATFDSVNLPFHMLWHTPSMFLKEDFLKLNKPIKLITAVRDPIARDISTLYQGLEFITSSPMIDKLNLQLVSPHIMSGGGDAQRIFDLLFNSKSGETPLLKFFDNFSKHIFDLSAHPFNQQLGYSIIKDGNLEIFTFQLEKLNLLAPIMSDWLNSPFDNFILSNPSSNKWLANSYNIAKSSLRIHPDYLEKLYSSSWIKHFYSIEDINSFKARWFENLL